ncbi:uracil-DNA glycosylase [Staphylococcus aureus]|nr:uracil-DNA glycosylase [Staphylococcus aureus]ORO06353.1 uracil-DNA glycosylase [Staphylococcus aureus]
MDLEKIAHDITISLLPRALDRHKIHNEWQEVGDDVIAFAKDSVARDYFSIYSSVLLGLQEEEKSKLKKYKVVSDREGKKYLIK